MALRNNRDLHYITLCHQYYQQCYRAGEYSVINGTKLSLSYNDDDCDQWQIQEVGNSAVPPDLSSLAIDVGPLQRRNKVGYWETYYIPP